MSVLQSDDRGVIVSCASCGTKNRLAFGRLDHSTRCAKCHADIALPAAPQEVESAAQFDTLVGQASLPILVDFWAPWCGPCRMVAPQIEQVAARNQGRMLVIKVNTDVVSDLATRLGIRSIPTLAVYSKGREAARTAGVMAADRIEAFVQDAAR